MLVLLLGLFRRSFRSRRDLLLENLPLRQQLMSPKRRNTRPHLNRVDRFFWVVAKHMWFKWKQALVIVTPETGFSGIGPASDSTGDGVPVIEIVWKETSPKETRELFFRMVAENPT
jgi:hypothetical protein